MMKIEIVFTGNLRVDLPLMKAIVKANREHEERKINRVLKEFRRYAQ